MSPTDLDDRIHQVVSHLADGAPEPTPFADIRSHQLSPERSAERTRRRGSLVAAAAGLALVLAITGVVVWLGSSHDSSRDPAPAGALTVDHEVVEYDQTIDATCISGTRQETGSADTMRVEVWGSSALHRYRMDVHYPDGSSRSQLFVGDAYYPSEIGTRGSPLGHQFQCNGGVGLFAIEPGQGSLFTLNPIAPLPTFPDGPHIVNTWLQYADVGTPIPGEHADATGRPAKLWRQTTTGYQESTSGAVRRATTELMEWLVAGRKVLERRTRDELDGGGSVTTRAVLVARDSVSVDADFFDTSAYPDRLPGIERPNTASVGSVSPPTTTISPQP